MWARIVGRQYGERRLRLVLFLLFVALAVPTGAVLWQAYGQLKWEAFHQYRGLAEELSGRIDSELAERVNVAEARSFAAYSFLNVGGEQGTGFLQRSPLSAFPVPGDIPGVIGYFQVDADGRFSTPLLPTAGVGDDTEADALGLSAAELAQRRALAAELRRILAGNRLVEGHEASGEAGQAMFDQLRQRSLVAEEGLAAEPQRKTEKHDADPGRAENYAKVADLQLDDALQRKSQSQEDKAVHDAREQAPATQAPPDVSRSRRVEQAALPESESPASNFPGDVAGARAPGAQAAPEPRITTFESEIDPLEFSQLGSGELVLFRKVWRNGERFVQGMLIDPDRFIEQVVLAAFRATTLSDVSNLVVGLGENIIRVAPLASEMRSESRSETRSGAPNSEYRTALEGELLYRSRLSSPFDSLELIFSVNELPAGPGARVLGWTTMLLLVVFGLGFIALYRLGVGQLRLARQQQDFVSSVSHELKTPLTSIRMYSEMLKEGWADEARRSQYYDFIHDESERLSRLISNVLQLASITRNAPRLELKPIAVATMLDRVRSKVSSQIERAGFELAIECNEESGQAVVALDEDCMLQIVINLVDNAIKFSRDAELRRVEIGARARPNGTVRFTVRDYGPGIPRDQMKKIFRLFYRPKSELTRETVGTGIGLAIVHQLAIAMGGEVDVVNRDPGAEFGILFRQEHR